MPTWNVIANRLDIRIRPDLNAERCGETGITGSLDAVTCCETWITRNLNAERSRETRMVVS